MKKGIVIVLFLVLMVGGKSVDAVPIFPPGTLQVRTNSMNFTSMGTTGNHLWYNANLNLSITENNGDVDYYNEFNGDFYPICDELVEGLYNLGGFGDFILYKNPSSGSHIYGYSLQGHCKKESYMEGFRLKITGVLVGSDKYNHNKLLHGTLFGFLYIDSEGNIDYDTQNLIGYFDFYLFIDQQIEQQDKKIADLESEIQELKDKQRGTEDWQEDTDNWKQSMDSWKTSLMDTITGIQTSLSLLQDCCNEGITGAGTWDNFKNYISSSVQRKMVCGYAEDNRLEHIEELGYSCDLTYKTYSNGRERVSCRCRSI
jgi:hypothetical protein